MSKKNCQAVEVYRGEKSLFDRIAPVYGLFYNYQTRHFEKVLDQVCEKWDLSKYKSMIDVGCGTGALCSVLFKRGFKVIGVDPAPTMLEVARQKTRPLDIDFMRANALEGLPFEDKSFDLSIASYVVHGLKLEERKVFYAELSRITKHQVILYDYTDKRGPITDFLEWLEGGDYFNFIKIAENEMKKQFQEVQVLKVGVRAAWYICEPKNLRG